MEGEHDGDMPPLEEFIDPNSVAASYDIDDSAPPPPDDEDDDPSDPNVMQEIPEGMMEVQDDSSMGFFGHKDSVYAIAAHPSNPDVAVSGGGDDVAYLWSMTSGEPLATLGGHTDSVADVAFNMDGALVATAGMDSNIHIWSTVDGSMVGTLAASSEADWLAWHPRGNVLLSGHQDFTVWLWNATSGDCMNVFSGHFGPVTIGLWAPDGKTAYTASEDGSVKMWNPKTGAATASWTISETAVTSLDLSPDGTLLAVGDAEGGTTVIHTAQGKPVAKVGGHQRPILSVKWAPAGSPLALLAIASVDGTLTLWDSVAGLVRHVVGTRVAAPAAEEGEGGEEEDAAPESGPGGLSAALWHPTVPVVFTSSNTGVITAWDARTGGLIRTLMGHQEAIHGLALSADAAKLVACSDDQHCLVFDLTAAMNGGAPAAAAAAAAQ